MAGSDASIPPPRLVPEVQLPPYSYVTGHYPHPTRDPAGHSYGQVPHEPAPLDPTNWQDSRDYLYGCDLFNYGYYWEAHEVWEGLWKASGRAGTTADFLKGLIKLAAAGVKHREGRSEGVRRHAKRAAELFEVVSVKTSGNTYAGLDVATLLELANRWEHHVMPVDSTAAPVAIVFDFALGPCGERHTG
jgi:hypothetical protein